MIYVDVYIEDPFLHNEVLTYHSEQLLDAGVRVFVSVQQSTRIGFVKQSCRPHPHHQSRVVGAGQLDVKNDTQSNYPLFSSNPPQSATSLF